MSSRYLSRNSIHKEIISASCSYFQMSESLITVIIQIIINRVIN